MAYSIPHTPPAFASVHSQCLFTAYENVKALDSVNYPNYKYIADIYINATLVARLRAFPDPTTYAGVFDVGPIIRSYIESQFAPTTSLAGNQYQPFVEAYIEFGEEYNDTTYTNVVTDSTRKYFDTYKVGPWSTNDVLSGKVDDFATNRPTITIDEDSTFSLVPYFSSVSGVVNYTVDLREGGYSIVSGGASVTMDNASGMVHINLARPTINTLTSQSGGDQVVFTMNGHSVTVNYTCNNKFTTYTIAFLNQYGGYESYDFRFVSRLAIDIERKTFQSEMYRLGASGAVSYDSGNRYYGRRATYASQQKQRMRVTSDLLTDAEYVWLKELAASPETYLLLDGKFVPCTLTANSYDVRTHAANRLTALELDIEYDGDYNSQFR